MTSTTPGLIIGTVTYMSPEQARGLNVDARADIWSFGVMLYEMLAGRRPFEGPTMSHIIVSILEHEPAPLAELALDIPVEIQRVVSRCLRKEKEERYPAINDMLEELQTIKDNLNFEARLRAGAKIVSRSGPLPVHPITKSQGTIFAPTRQVPSKKKSTQFVIDSLAVLPLANASWIPTWNTFQDGITETIINNLAQLPKLRVVPNWSNFIYALQEDS